MVATASPPAGMVERLGAVGLAAGIAGALWPTAADATGLGLPCPLRATTGVPCPLCGMTTATVALVRGRVADAVAANPLVLVLAVLAVASAVLTARRLTGRGARWAPPPIAAGWVPAGVASAIGAAWVWQLHRFALIG